MSRDFIFVQFYGPAPLEVSVEFQISNWRSKPAVPETLGYERKAADRSKIISAIEGSKITLLLCLTQPAFKI